MRKPPTGIVLHCWASRHSKTCDELHAECLRNTDPTRPSRFPYDFGVEQYGTVHAGEEYGRLLYGQGAHCRGFNGVGSTPRYIGIGLAGNFEQHPPSFQQMSVLYRMVPDLSMEHRIPLERIFAHYQLNPHKDCPGRLFPWVSFMTNLAASGVLWSEDHDA